MSKKYIRNPFKYLPLYKEGDEVYVGIRINDSDLSKISDLGFETPLVEGECIIPESKHGKWFFENSEGKVIIHKDLEKETAYRYRTWDFKDWHGNWHTASSYVPYKRYPRTRLSPCCIEFAVFKEDDSWLLVTASPIKKLEENTSLFLVSMNMFLSYFGRFETFDSNLKAPTKRINHLPWELLRAGTRQNVESALNDFLKKSSESEKDMYRGDLELLYKFNPEMVAIGQKGFYGYIAFFYPSKKIAVLESVIPNNATYIFDESWEDFSKLTKTEVLNNKLQKGRVIHNEHWDERITSLLK